MRVADRIVWVVVKIDAFDDAEEFREQLKLTRTIVCNHRSGLGLTDQVLVSLGTVLIFGGFALLLATILIPMFRAGRLRGRGGGVIIIGPLPIVFASDKQSAKILLILAIVLVALLVGFLVLESLV